MNKHNTLRKKRTLKKHKKAQFRRYNRQTTLSSKMKGGASSTILKSAYIIFRQKQKNDASRVLEAIKYTAPPALRSKIEKLNNLLPIHIRETQDAPNTERWRTQEHTLYILINTINILLIAKNYKKDGKRLRISQPFMESTSVTNDIEPSQQSIIRKLSQQSIIRKLSQKSRSRSRSRELPQESRTSPISLS